jgi:large-conductance mechanosensitive channel
MPMIEPIMPDIASWETYVIGPFRIGHFTGELISFIIVAFVIFILVKITTRYGIE